MAAPAIEVRRVSFEEDLTGIPRLFGTDSNLFYTHIFVVLSAIFPPGEEFFIRTVRDYRANVGDPELKRDVSRFIGQESMHGREHDRLNEILTELGHRNAKTTKATVRFLKWVERTNSSEVNLAVTSAIEHLTAILGEFVLEYDLADYIEHDGIRRLLQWHALEECEHKAVTFDLFRDQINDERLRIMAMKGVRPVGLAYVAFFVALGVLADPKARNLRRLRRDFNEARRSPVFSRKVWRALKAYDRPGFHPNDVDTDHLVARFRQELFAA